MAFVIARMGLVWQINSDHLHSQLFPPKQPPLALKYSAAEMVTDLEIETKGRLSNLRWVMPSVSLRR